MLWLFVTLSALLGLSRFNRYGESWDERVDFNYGEAAVEHYGAPPEYWEQYDLRHYGPAYLAVAHAVASQLPALVPSWETTDARHFVNHLVFQIATVALFYLSRRYMAAWPALLVSLLFATQPLLFGHSFINQKDIPFLTAFLVATTVGFAMGDEPSESQAPAGTLLGEWREASTAQKAALAVAGAFAGLACFELIFLKAALLPAMEGSVRLGYTGSGAPVFVDWFSRVAQQAQTVPLEEYLSKTRSLYSWFRWPIVMLVIAPFLVLLVRRFPSSLSWVRRSAVGFFLLSMIGGAVAGLTIAIRVLGLVTLGIVALPVILGKRWGRLAFLAVYAATAAVVCYAAWPFLHGSPLEHLLESWSVMSRYPWSGGVLFMGRILDPNSLPWFYVPVLMGIQLTLPVVLLTIVGIGLAIRRIARAGDRWGEVATLVVWLVAPIFAVIALRATLYNNFRQLLFLLPPLFVIAGLTVDSFLARIRSVPLAVGLVALSLAPGLVGIVQHHPYEYIYYNGLVGGVGGAFRSYELDYWCTSYREAMTWINRVAPPGSEIAAAPPHLVAANAARSDLSVFYAQLPDDLAGGHPVLGLGCGRGNNDLGFFPEKPVSFEVVVDGARLSVVRDFLDTGEGGGD